MAKKYVDLAAITAISEQAAHIKNVDDNSLDKMKIKTKTITYPEFWESTLFNEQINSSWNTYEKLVSLGVDKEDARFILPHGAETRIVVTMNARELHHFFTLRLCKRAQWEIRELARKMLTLVRAAEPDIFALAGPSCVTRGECTEAHSCGVPYTDMETMLSE